MGNLSIYIYIYISSEGVLYLYVKTIERAHTPAHMWERIKLSNNYTKALEQVSYYVTNVENVRDTEYISDRIDRQRAYILAQLHYPQVQAEGDKNYSVSDQDAKAPSEARVRLGEHFSL